MFQELMPILRQRTVLMIISHIKDDELSVSIVPKKLQESENAALCTPLSVSGTPAELDKELPQTIVEFVGAHLTLKQSLDAAKTEMDAAAKAAREEAKSKTKTVTKEPAAKTDTTKKTEPATTAEPAKPEPPRIPSLFDTVQAGGEPPNPDPPAASTATELPKTEVPPPAATTSLPITYEESEEEETVTNAEEADAAYYNSPDAA